MEMGQIYLDRYNNRVQIISDDFTGLNRGIVYGQFIDRVKTPISKKVFVERLKNNILTHSTFAIWEWNFKHYKLWK